MSEYNGTYEFVFFHDQKKGEIIVIMNGQKHVFDDGVSKAIKAERERIVKVAKEWISEYRGHDGECDCLAKAQVLENFINHDDFKGEQK